MTTLEMTHKLAVINAFRNALDGRTRALLTHADLILTDDNVIEIHTGNNRRVTCYLWRRTRTIVKVADRMGLKVLTYCAANGIRTKFI